VQPRTRNEALETLGAPMGLAVLDFIDSPFVKLGDKRGLDFIPVLANPVRQRQDFLGDLWPQNQLLDGSESFADSGLRHDYVHRGPANLLPSGPLRVRPSSRRFFKLRVSVISLVHAGRPKL
jgi:hypothetical protein